MRGVVLLSALVIGALVFVFVGVCLADQAPLMPHLEGSEGCCGLLQCSGLAISVFVLGLWIAATFVWLPTTTPVLSANQPPVVPPPELIFLASA